MKKTEEQKLECIREKFGYNFIPIRTKARNKFTLYNYYKTKDVKNWLIAICNEYKIVGEPTARWLDVFFDTYHGVKKIDGVTTSIVKIIDIKELK